MPLTLWFARPARCRKVVIERGQPSWQTSSTSPHIDAELEAKRWRRAHAVRSFKPLFGVEAPFLGEAPMMGGDVLGADQLGQVARGALPPCAAC